MVPNPTLKIMRVKSLYLHFLSCKLQSEKTMSTARKSTDQTVLDCAFKLSLLVISILFICKPFYSCKNFDLISSSLSISEGQNLNLSSTSKSNLRSDQQPSLSSSVFAKSKRKTNTDPSCYLSKHQILIFYYLISW